MQNKVQDIIVEAIKKKAGNRELVFWGGWEPKGELRDCILQKTGLKLAFCVTAKAVKVENNIFEVQHISAIKGKKETYFVVAFPKETDESRLMFQQCGYGKEDVFYIHHKPVRVTGAYKDEFGNSVSALPANCEVFLEGYGSSIDIGKVTAKKYLKIVCGNNSHVKIADRTVFENEFSIMARELSLSELQNLSVVIGEDNRFDGGSITSFSGDIQIAEKCTFGKNLSMVAGYGMKILVGKDCMFSHDIRLFSGDGHLIFDCHTREPMNSLSKLEDRKKVLELGEHTWVGLRATILNGANIGNGSVIGAGSLVKGSFPNNCILTGNPAKVIRKDIAWSRQPVDENILLCGEEYINFSEGGE